MIAERALPCTTLAYDTRAAAARDQRELLRSTIHTRVVYCGACDSYHLGVVDYDETNVRMLTLLAQGFRWEETRAEVGLSDRAFKRRMEKMRARFYASNQTNLIAIAIALGVIDMRPFIPLVKEQPCQKSQTKRTTTSA